MRSLNLYVLIGVLVALLSGCGERPRKASTLTVVLVGAEHASVNVWLTGGGLREARSASGDGPEYVFRDVPRGTYVVSLDPDYEDWASHCVAYREVVVGEEQHTETIPIPAGKLVVTTRFQSLPPPTHRADLAVARVERLSSGRADPTYRQWLFVTPKDGSWTGELDYLDPGEYRITFFTVDYEMPKPLRSTDRCSQDIVVDEALLERGTVTLTY